MAMCWVKIERSDGAGVGSAVYVDENYVDAAGLVGTPFRVDTGEHNFETVDSGLNPTWQKIQRVIASPGNSQQTAILVTLEPVSPGNSP